MGAMDVPDDPRERIANHEARIRTLEGSNAQLRREVHELHGMVQRLEVAEEKREARVMAAISEARAVFVGSIADLRVETAEHRARSWRKAMELVIGSGGAGGALGTGIYALLQSLGGG